LSLKGQVEDARPKRTQDTSDHPHREGGGVVEMGGEMYFSQSVTSSAQNVAGSAGVDAVAEADTHES
jgi:hypothetical protein